MLEENDSGASGSEEQEGQQEQEQLGDAGQKALAAERDARKRAEKEAKAATAELARLKSAGQSEQEKAVEQAKAEGRAEADTRANERIVRAEIRAAAAGKLADPADALHFLDPSDFKVDSDGEVDTKAIAKAVDQLAKDKPYLASGKADRGFDGGARRTADEGDDMNAVLRRATGRIS